MNLGISIEAWTFPVFKKQLIDAGYRFQKFNGVVPGTLLLTLKADSKEAIQAVVVKANAECAKLKQAQHMH